MKKSLFKTMMILFGLSLMINISAQVQINGVSDSTAILNESFSAQMDVGFLGSAPSYELLESPADMDISPSGEITWTPTDVADGGRVTVRSWNAGGSDSFTFNVYISDQVVCSPNLIAYYQMDETSGTTYSDFINPNNDGTALTPLNDTVGMVGNAQIFKPTSATSQFITVPDNDQMEYTVADKFSVSMWVNSYGTYSFPSGDPNQVIWAREEMATADERYILGGLWEDGGSLYPIFRVRRNSSTMGEVLLTQPLPKKTWTLLTFVYEGIASWGEYNIRIYVNDELPAGGQLTSWFSGGENLYMNSPLSIGWFPPSITEKNPFNGKMDEVMFFDKALSLGEVQAIYQDGLNGEAHCKAGNYAPLFTNEFPATVDEDEEYSVTVTTSDFDGDAVLLSDSVLPGWLNLNAGSGLLYGTPTNDDLGTHEVVLKITDGEVKISKTFNILVENTNDAPTISSTYTTSVDEDQLYTYDIEYSDVDPGDVLTLTAVHPDWLFLNTGTNTLSGTPTNAALGTEPFVDFDIKVKVTDAAGDSAVQKYILRVDNINDPPTILAQNTLSTAGSTAIQLDIETVFSAGDIVDIDNVFPDDFELTIQSGTNYLLGANNTITPVDGFRGDLSVSAMLSDGEEVVPYTILVTVDNNAPVITSVPSESIQLDGTPYVYNITAEDLDQDDELVYNADLIPDWLDFDQVTHILMGTPTDPGIFDVVLSVTDGVSTATQPYTITVVLTGIEDLDESALQLYPIPARDKLFVEYANSFNNGVFEIMDIKGNTLVQRNFDSFEGKLIIDITEYSAGLYIYRVTFDDQVYTGKIIIE